MDNPIQPASQQNSIDSNHSARIVGMFVILLVIAIIFGVIGYFFGANHQKPPKQPQIMQTSSQPTTSISNPQKMEQVYTLGRPLNSKGNYKITLTVPTAWRTTLKYYYDEPDTFTEFNDNLGEFLFVTNTSSNAISLPSIHGPFEPDSNLGFWDVTNWLKTDGPIPNSKSGWDMIQIPISQKQAYMNYLINLRNSKQVDLSKCPTIGTGDGTLNCYGNIADEYIESADKVFSGYAGIRLNYQSVTYDPTVRVFMAGVIDGKTMYAEGEFFIHDKFSQELSNSTDEQAIMNARQQIQKSLPADTQAIYQQILTSIKSLTITRPQ